MSRRSQDRLPAGSGAREAPAPPRLPARAALPCSGFRWVAGMAYVPMEDRGCSFIGEGSGSDPNPAHRALRFIETTRGDWGLTPIPGTTAGEPLKFTRRVHRWSRYRSGRQGAAAILRRNADDLHPSAAGDVHRPDHVLVLHLRIALHEHDLVRARIVDVLELRQSVRA